MLRIYAKLRRIKGSFLLLFGGISTTPSPPVQERLLNNTNEPILNNSSEDLGSN